MEGTWTPKPIRNPLLSFVGLYIIVAIFYAGYVVGMTFWMERELFKDKKWDKDNIISLFVVFTGGLVIVLFNKGQIEREKEKARQLLLLVKEYSALSQIFFHQSMLNSNDATTSTIVIGDTKYARRILIFETNLYILTSLMMLYCEQTSDIFTSLNASAIFGMLKSSSSYNSDVESTYQWVTKNWSSGLVTCLSTRFMDVHKSKLLSKSAVEWTSPRLRNIEGMTNELVAYTKTDHPRWIKVILLGFSLSYLAAVPFLLWITQEMMTILWSMVVFLFFGSYMIYRYYIGDALKNPTKWGVGYVVDDMMKLASDSDEQMANFPKTADANVTVKRYSTVYGGYLGIDTDSNRNN